ncbi:MAG TPA: hypothetical protein PKU93_00680 [Candidatus Pacearchaeota archaeon]|nr:hypothetical protein [Candidatus Pacearchaeota archaeon]
MLRKITGKTEDEMALEELKSANNEAEIFLFLSIKKIDERDLEAVKRGCKNVLTALDQKAEKVEKIFHKNLEQGTHKNNFEISLKNARELKQKLEAKIATFS